MLEARGITRRYGRRWALAGVSLSVARGRRLALLGENGSGKTTLLKILARLLRPAGGEVFLDGKPLAQVRRDRVGFLAHAPYLYPALTLRENLNFFAKLFGMAPGPARERVGALARGLGLADRLDDPVRTLSQGLRQRGALARTLLHGPDVVLLDEPFAGLDPSAAERLERIMGGLDVEGGERMLIFSTHDPERALSLSDEVAVLTDGRVKLAGASGGFTPGGLARAISE